MQIDDHPSPATGPLDGSSAADRAGEQALTLGLTSGKFLLRVEEVADVLDISRTRVYDLIRSGELQSLKIGGSRRVPSTAVQLLVDRLLRGTPQ